MDQRCIGTFLAIFMGYVCALVLKGKGWTHKAHPYQIRRTFPDFIYNGDDDVFCGSHKRGTGANSN